MTLVVDASVALKWFVHEAQCDAARALLNRDDPLTAPDFILVEIANASWRKAVRNEISYTQAKEIESAMRLSEVVLHPSADLAERALTIAIALNHPAYDCFYIACAERIDGLLVTDDSRLCRAVEGTAFASLVCPLHGIVDKPP